MKVVIIGSDINAYYMARNVHELYGVKAHLIGKTEMLFTKFSKIVTKEFHEDFWDNETFKKILKDYAEKNRDGKEKILLIGSTDRYVRMISENRDFLKKYYLFNYAPVELMDKLLNKNEFYTVFNDYDIDIPLTYVYKCGSGNLDLKQIKNFKYPIIIKPGNVLKYYEYEFPGKAKVYKVKTKDELVNVIELLETVGYDETLIIQEYIPGDDTLLFDSILYVNQKGKTELMSFAQVALQEHTKTGIGNCTVLVNGYNEYNNTATVVPKLRSFLEDIGYQGIAEFDLKYDTRDQKFKVLEVNPRQARSSYYLTACGYNLVKYLAEDLFENKEHEFKLIEDKMVLSFVPKHVIKKHIHNEKVKKEILKLIREGKLTRPLHYKKDNSLKRTGWLLVRDFNYIKKYKENTW